MKAVLITAFGPPEVLQLADVSRPDLGQSEILIRVKASGVARADILQRMGHYPPPEGASQIPGLDVAGIVEALGSSVQGFSVGDPVCAILSGGGYAEFCTAPAEQVLPIPTGWSFTEAATLPENLFTVYDNVVTRAGLSKGETLLIHGGSSGIGTMAIMLAKLFDATVVVTAGSDAKCKACLELGAHFAINYKTTPNFASEVMRLTNKHGADVILDMVGGSYLEANLSTLATEGRLVIIATQGGTKSQLDIATLMRKRARILGSTMRARTAAEKGLVAKALSEHIWPILPEKQFIRPIIDSTFALQDAAAAHKRLESGTHIGRVVLTQP